MPQNPLPNPSPFSLPATRGTTLSVGMVVLIAICGSVPLAQGAIPDVVLLEDGSRLAGAIEVPLKAEGAEDADLDEVQLRTLSGIQRIARADIRSITDAQTLLKEYRRLQTHQRSVEPSRDTHSKEEAQSAALSGAVGHWALATWCERHGLFEEMLDELDASLDAQPSFAPAQDRLQTLVDAPIFQETDRVQDFAALKKYLRRYSHKGPARQRLAALRIAPRFQSWVEARAATNAPSRLPLRGIVLHGTERAQLLALEILKSQRDPSSSKTIVDATLQRGRDRVQIEARTQLSDHPESRVLPALAKALGSSKTERREDALYALAAYPSPGSLAMMINHLAYLQTPQTEGSANPGATRAYFFGGTLQNYVAGYETQIANNAFIAQPVIRTITTGQVLDVTIYGVSGRGGSRYLSEQELTTNLLRHASGQDFGLTTEHWKTWWNAKYRPQNQRDH